MSCKIHIKIRLKLSIIKLNYIAKNEIEEDNIYTRHESGEFDVLTIIRYAANWIPKNLQFKS